MQIFFEILYTIFSRTFFDNRKGRFSFTWLILCLAASFASGTAVAQDSVDVKFFYKSTGHPTSVFLPGEFNNWGPNNNGVIAQNAPSKMAFDAGLGQWTKTVRLRVGGHVGGGVAGAYQYKINENGANTGWRPDPLNPRQNPSDNNNSILYVRNPTIHYLLPNELSAALKTRFPQITAYVFPTATGAIDTSTIKVSIDGTIYDHLGDKYDAANNKFSFVPTAALTDGSHKLKLSARSTTGAVAVSDSTNFIVQGDALQIVTQPATTRKATWPIRAEIYKADGTLDAEVASAVVTKDGAESWSVTVTGGKIDTAFTLTEGENVFIVEATQNNVAQTSAPITITQIVHHSPYAVIDIDTSNAALTLSASNSTDPEGQSLTFDWAEDDSNPAAIGIDGFSGSVFSGNRPTTPGEYYYTLMATDPDDNTDVTRNYFIVSPGGGILTPTLASNPGWVKNAVVYEIFPLSFSTVGNIAQMESQLPYIKAMGYNVLWLMPVMKNRGGITPVGGGYDIVDFYQVDSNYGNVQDMRDFIAAAHSLGIKVVLDITPNHVSEEHPWVQEARLYRENSRYWNYLEHRRSGQDGQSPSNDGVYLHYYDWALANLNNADVDCQHELIEVFKFWLLEVGADGFRFDVYWGPSGRYGEAAFWRPVREALKHVKPDIWLLAEAGGVGVGTEIIYADKGGGADAGYDWNLLGIWPSVFNSLNVTALHNGIFNNNYYPGPNAFFFRFLENHDEWRVAQRYKPAERTLPGAAVLMTAPGIPMIYAGQEVGFGDQFQYQDGNDDLRLQGNRGKIDLEHPTRAKTQGLYQKLAHLRAKFPAFWTQTLIGQVSNNVYVFSRPYTDENAIVAANFSNTTRAVTIQINSSTVSFSGGLQAGKTYFISELISGVTVSMIGDAMGNVSFSASIPAYGSAVYMVSTEPESITVPDIPTGIDNDEAVRPERFVVHANYPNPFNPETTIRFELPKAAEVNARVFNLLGEEVITLAQQPMAAGTHTLRWNGLDSRNRQASSGIYFLRVSAGKNVAVRKMMVVR